MPLHLPHDLYTQLRLAVTEADEYRLTPQALAALQNEPRPEPVAAPPLDPRNPFTLLPSAAAVLQHLYEQAPFVGGFLAQVNGLITPLLSIVSAAPDAGIAATLQLDTNHYTSAHAIQVAALIVVIRPLMQFDEAECHVLMQAALCMNLASSALQDNLDRQLAPLSSRQSRDLRIHPLLSSAWMHEMGVEDPLLHRLVCEHHERLDGRGYPARQTRDEIHPLSHVLQVLDELTARFSPRSHRLPLQSAQIMRELFARRGTHTENKLVEAAIKTLGLYPSGLLVRLGNGRNAMVWQQTDKVDQPRVVLLESDGRFSPLDLRQAGFGIQEQVVLRPSRQASRHLRQAWGYAPETADTL
ncbi:hypothetical protein LH447_00045 [Laribacter hongkongensis]|uniref:HD-GYP domain-containing protein n=1 Tax=Laribacter hongkongensis TaxID=168471 RepID=UPI001EFCC963|nr:HD domain-containing phosphohydrolase [Laribacter hongkongensis]MCG9051503.1 hypothetical protein [Laribacter hongkongensis]